ncbi:MAG: SusC/RagA family TonB-linked outer membrane protein [Bacteroidota bacterium]|nr:SusC/RagA family TonB-linked outer membrane protein [Bacteroidota bacterium]
MKLFLKVNAVLLFLFASLLARGQTVTLSVTNQPIEKVFLLVEKQTGYNFIYSNETIAKAKPITLTVKEKPLDPFLKLCFKDQPLTYNVEQRHIVVKELPSQTLPARSDFRGKIINASGDPVAGATISVKGQTLSVITDTYGEFVIPNVSDLITLQITGAEIEPKELKLTSLSFTTIIVTAKINQLDETFVIAYGKSTRRYSTGDVTSIKHNVLSRQPISNPLAGLMGRVTGLQVTQASGVPGSFFSVRLRGQNSIANGNDPLYIIDGVPFGSATLTSNLGGGAGVISSPLSNLNPSDIESIEVLKDADATAIYGSRGANGVILITTKKGKPGQTRFDFSCYSGIGHTDRSLDLLSTPDYIAMRREAFANDGVIPNNANAVDLVIWDSNRYTDWQHVLLGENFQIMDLNLSVSGGSEKTQFIVGAGYHHEGTPYPGHFGEEKASGHYALNHVSADQRFNLSLQGSYIRNSNQLPQTDLTTSITLAPNAPSLYTPDGKLNWQNSTWTNPLSFLQRKYTTLTDNLIANLALSYKIIAALQLKLSFGFNSMQAREHVVTPISSYDPAFNLTGSAGFGNTSVTATIVEPQVVYTRRIAQGDLQLLSGFTFQDNRQSTLVQLGNGYTSDALLNSLSAASSITTNADKSIKYRYEGLFARLNYDWRKKYILTLTARRDGSTRFGPGNRFANFGSLGGAWIFTKEKFFPLHFITYGKLKVSWGKTGNDQIGDYKYLDTYSPYTYGYQGTSTLYPTQLFNPSYGWEQVGKWESGIDLSLFNERILASVNFYCNTTTNQLVSYPLSNVTGFDGILENIPAVIRNRGWEFQISSINVKNKNWKWTTTFNLTVPKNKLVSYPNLSASTYANTYVIGEPLFIVKRFQYIQVDPSTGVYQFQDFNKDGSINAPNDQQQIIFTGQQFFGGMEQILEYKKWSLSFFVQFVRQRTIPNYLSAFPRPGVQSNQPTWVMNRWQKPGQLTDIEKFTNASALPTIGYNFFRNSDAAYSDGSYARLKNVYITYKVNEYGSVFLQAQNFITFTKYKGLDPETKSVLPPSRIISAGILLHL